MHALLGTMRILIFPLRSTRQRKRMTCEHQWNEIGNHHTHCHLQSDVCTLFSPCFQALMFTGPM
jgi:hypothetical protein